MVKSNVMFEIAPEIDPSSKVGSVFRLLFMRVERSLDQLASIQGVDLESDRKVPPSVGDTPLLLFRSMDDWIGRHALKRTASLSIKGDSRPLVQVRRVGKNGEYTPLRVASYPRMGDYWLQASGWIAEDSSTFSLSDNSDSMSPEKMKKREGVLGYGNVNTLRRSVVSDLSENEQLALNTVNRTIRCAADAIDMVLEGMAVPDVTAGLDAATTAVLDKQCS